MYSLVIEEGLRAEDFYRERHRTIYARDGRPLRAQRADRHASRSPTRCAPPGCSRRPAAPRASTCSPAPVPNVANLRHYAQIVRDTALLRRLLNATYEIQSSVLDQREPAREIVEHAERIDARGRPRRARAGLPLDLLAARTTSSTRCTSCRSPARR